MPQIRFLVLRTVLVKLASICVLVVSIFQRNKSDKVIVSVFIHLLFPMQNHDIVVHQRYMLMIQARERYLVPFYWLPFFRSRHFQFEIWISSSSHFFCRNSTYVSVFCAIFKFGDYNSSRSRSRKYNSFPQCWENLLGAEMYKLIWMDFFVSLFVTFFIEYPRGYVFSHHYRYLVVFIEIERGYWGDEIAAPLIRTQVVCPNK